MTSGSNGLAAAVHASSQRLGGSCAFAPMDSNDGAPTKRRTITTAAKRKVMTESQTQTIGLSQSAIEENKLTVRIQDRDFFDERFSVFTMNSRLLSRGQLPNGVKNEAKAAFLSEQIPFSPEIRKKIVKFTVTATSRFEA